MNRRGKDFVTAEELKLPPLKKTTAKGKYFQDFL